MRTPESRGTGLYDFEVCVSDESLKRVIATINQYGWELVCISAYERKFYVFFRRPLR